MTKLKNKGAGIKRVISNIAWLCKPYWQEKKLFFILFILFGVAITPIQDFIYVYFPKQIVDMLIPAQQRHYLLLSKSGFTPSARDDARRNKQVILLPFV